LRCLRTGCRGEYLDLKGRKVGCINRGSEFVIVIDHITIIISRSDAEGSNNGRHEKRINILVRKQEWKRVPPSRRTWVNNIKMNRNKQGVRVWTGFIWLRKGITDEPL
jgi:hypothetical protein